MWWEKFDGSFSIFMVCFIRRGPALALSSMGLGRRAGLGRNDMHAPRLGGWTLDGLPLSLGAEPGIQPRNTAQDGTGRAALRKHVFSCIIDSGTGSSEVEVVTSPVVVIK
jgi:hypothetical protein